jgi:hypothetical protein
MKIFYDSDFKCHTVNDGTMKSVELVFFDGKGDACIEGYCYDDSKGYPQIYPWKPYNELAAAQAQYEADLADAAAAYQEGVNSV